MKVLVYGGRRPGIGHAHTLALLVQCGLGSHPYYGVYGQLVAEDYLAVVVYVYDGRQSGKRQPKLIQKTGILAVTEGVVLIVQPLLVVA